MISLIFQNHYERLQVSREATDEEIKAAYRRMARVYHPDVARDRKAGHEAFLLIKEAYEVLADAAQRRDYDELIGASERFKARKPRPPRGAPDARSAGASGAPPPKPRPRPQASSYAGPRPDTRRPHREDLDVHATLEISLEEALFGSIQNVTFEDDPPLKADHHFKSIEVSIPRRCPAGQVLELKNKGQRDPRSLEQGHLYLTIAYARHERFRLLGHNLFTSIEVFPWDGALGSMVAITTLDGRANLKIPAGSQPWQSFRMEGFGMPDKEGKRGDLIVSLRFLQPPAESPLQSALWKQLKEAYK